MQAGAHVFKKILSYDVPEYKGNILNECIDICAGQTGSSHSIRVTVHGSSIAATLVMRQLWTIKSLN